MEPVKEATSSQIVRASLDDRPLADVSDELLDTMVKNPEHVRGEHAEAVAEAERLKGRASRAERATE